MYKRIDIELENLKDDDVFEKCLEDEKYLNEILQDEIENIRSQVDELINNKGFIIVKTLITKFTYRHFHGLSIYDCDQFGNIQDKSVKNRKDNNDKITSAKFSIMEKYLISKHIHVVSSIPNRNYIVFSCPVCGKTNGKCHINSLNFKIGTFSQNDCTNEIHDRVFTKMQKELKKLWDNSNEKKELVFSMNIDYISNIIENKFPKIVRYNNSLYYYKGRNYIEMVDNDEVSDVERLIYEYFFNENDNVLTKKQLNDIKNYIKKNYKFENKIPEKSNLINCNNGVLDIDTGKLFQHSDKYFFNYTLDIDYNPGPDNKILDTFLNDIGIDKDMLCKILGHIHYQGSKLQKGFIFKGTKQGRNGKGTLCKLIEKVIQRSVTMSVNSFTESSFNTYQLKDKALYIEDDYKANYMDEKIIGLLNRIISQSDDVVHQKNKPAIKIRHTAVPIIQCNKLPKLKAEDDGGFYKRFVIVNFNKEFGDCMDEFLGDRLLNDKYVMSSMLNYLILGYKELMYRKNNHITAPFFGEDNYIEEWKKENNSAIQYVEENCRLSNDQECSSRELYNDYRNNWNLGGSKMSETKFIKEIKEYYKLESVRRRTNSGKVTMLVGISLDDTHLTRIK